jgi:chromosome segregation ATPase
MGKNSQVEIARLRSEVAARDRELATIREGFSRDLDKLRETAERAEERLRATEKRALLEIDRERGVVVKLQKEVDETTKQADQREADHRRAVETLQAQLGDARHQAGVLQGRLDAVQVMNATLQAQLAEHRRAETEQSSRGRAKTAASRSTATRPAVGRPAQTPAPVRKAPRRKTRGQP